MPGDVTLEEMNELGTHFFSLFNDLNVDRDKLLHVFNLLIQKYSEPSRSYHTLKHIHSMLSYLETQDVHDRRVVELAVWFHDAIYDTAKTDNELESAMLARAILRTLDVHEDIALRASVLVMATADHTTIDPKRFPDYFARDMEIFLDADMSILGAPPEEYALYARGIKEEYSEKYTGASVTRYREGRITFLTELLGRKKLFLTKSAQKQFEQQARENIAWEIGMLQAGEM